MRRLIPVLLTSGALLVAGCGSDDEDSPAAAPQASVTADAPETPTPAEPSSGDAVTIGMLGLEFDPTDVTVKKGTTVKWVNNEEIPHNVVATKGAKFESETFGKDGTFEYVADTVGTIDYVCTLHPNMIAKLTVEG